jgi:hypothetical protein
MQLALRQSREGALAAPHVSVSKTLAVARRWSGLPTRPDPARSGLLRVWLEKALTQSRKETKCFFSASWRRPPRVVCGVALREASRPIR